MSDHTPEQLCAEILEILSVDAGFDRAVLRASGRLAQLIITLTQDRPSLAILITNAALQMQCGFASDRTVKAVQQALPLVSSMVEGSLMLAKAQPDFPQPDDETKPDTTLN